MITASFQLSRQKDWNVIKSTTNDDHVCCNSTLSTKPVPTVTTLICKGQTDCRRVEGSIPGEVGDSSWL